MFAVLYIYACLNLTNLSIFWSISARGVLTVTISSEHSKGSGMYMLLHWGQAKGGEKGELSCMHRQYQRYTGGQAKGGEKGEFIMHAQTVSKIHWVTCSRRGERRVYDACTDSIKDTLGDMQREGRKESA